VANEHLVTKFPDPAKIDLWHMWLINPATKFTDPVKNRPVAQVANQPGHKFTDPA
jgi:hypothetical protein